MSNLAKRHTVLGRAGPLAFYVVIVLGWVVDAVAAGATSLLWLVLWTLPAPVLYLRRTRR